MPIDPFAADQLEVVRGPATLRYGSQAIGGVVNASNDRIPEFIPPRGFSAEIARRPQLRRRRRRRRLQGHGRRRQLRRARRCLPAAGPTTTTRRTAGSSTRSSTATALRSAPRWSARTASSASPSSRFNSLYGIPGGEAAEEAHAHRPAAGQGAVEGRMARARLRHRGDPLLVRRHQLRPQRGADSRAATLEIGSRFTNASRKAASRSSTCRSGRRSASCAARSACRSAIATCGGMSFEGDSLLDPARTNSVAAFWFEELQVTRAAAPAGGRPHRAHARSTAPALDLHRSRSPRRSSRGRAHLQAQERQRRRPLRAAARRRGARSRRSTWSGRRPTPSSSPRARTRRPAPSRSAIPSSTMEKASTFELGFKRAKGAVALRCLRLLHEVRRLHLQAASPARPATATLDSCTPAGGGELDQILFAAAQRHLLRRRAAGASSTSAASGAACGASTASTTSCAPGSTTRRNGNVPRIPPHRAGARHLLSRRQLVRAHRLPARLRAGRDRRSTRRRPTGYTLLNADLAYTFKLDPQRGVVPEMTIGIKGENLLDDDVRNTSPSRRTRCCSRARTSASTAS